MRAILLVGHGSRKRESVHCLYDVAQALESDHEIVEVAFLELCPPTIQEGFDACVGRGATHTLLLPYFLFPGGHVYRDLPNQVEQARQRHPTCRFALGQVMGYDPILVQLVKQRIDDSLAREGWVIDSPRAGC